MSHCRTPPFNDHLDHCFIVFEHIQQSFLTRGLDVWGNRINILQHVDLPLRILTSFSINRSQRSVWSLSHISKKQKQLDPMTPEQATRLLSIQCPKKWSQILLNCAKQQFVSCTSNLLEQKYDFRKCTMFLQKWISNLQDLPRSQSLETVPICTV